MTAARPAHEDPTSRQAPPSAPAAAEYKPRARRRPDAALSRERILIAAMQLADREGLAELSMRRLGRELGVQAMSLYNYFPNKAALLAGLIETMLEEIEPVSQDGDGWEERLRAVMLATRQIGHRHPSVFLLFATRRLASRRRPPAGISSRRGQEDLQTLRAAGFDERSAYYALRTLVGYVVGHVLSEVGDVFAEEDRAPEAGGPAGSPAAAQERTRSARPAMAADDLTDATFEAGLDVIFAGLRVFLAGSSSGANARPPGDAPP